MKPSSDAASSLSALEVVLAVLLRGLSANVVGVASLQVSKKQLALVIVHSKSPATYIPNIRYQSSITSLMAPKKLMMRVSTYRSRRRRNR